MDPVTQTLAQQHSGSAGGHNFASFFIAGQERADRQRQMKMMQRQQDVLLPLQQQSMQLKMASIGMEMVEQQKNAEHETGTRAGALRISQLMSELERDGTWGTPESWAKYDSIIKHTPLAALSKQGEVFLQTQRLRTGIAQLTKQFGAPAQVTTPLPGGGEAKFGTDPLEKQRVDISKGNLDARLKEIDLARQRLEGQMDPMQREKLRAGLRAIATDIYTDGDKKLQKMDSFIKQFSGPAPAPANVADPLGLFE